MKKKLCPTCRKKLSPAQRKAPFFPFCSERCQLIDLGRWFREDYTIPASPPEPETGDNPNEKT
jgi:endogenous inhibitor of DNA gyrase (YacG/DUF329 family)